MGSICSRDQPIQQRKVEPVGRQNDIARPEGDRRETNPGSYVRRATLSHVNGNRTFDQTATAARRSRAAGLRPRPSGSKNFKVLEELEARRRKTRKAERDRR
ncbi:hypothetical protein HOY80DRAFT_1134084 [Tuber brumale]|nr:hypothetical protein HOY80DRAFT_1134084 [Tuber brumale]